MLLLSIGSTGWLSGFGGGCLVLFCGGLLVCTGVFVLFLLSVALN